MTRITDLELLVRIADLGNLTAAAKALDWSPAAASAALKRMEEQLGFPLFVRSTRSLRLSGEGQRYLPHARAALRALTDGRDEALAGRAPFNVPGGANDAVSMAPRVRTMPLPPTRRPDVPESLERTLRTAMAKSPHERYESALVFARALQAIQAELHLPVTTIDVLDEQVVDVGPPEEGVGTRLSGFVSIDPEPAPAPTSARGAGPLRNRRKPRARMRRKR